MGDFWAILAVFWALSGGFWIEIGIFQCAQCIIRRSTVLLQGYTNDDMHKKTRLNAIRTLRALLYQINVFLLSQNKVNLSKAPIYKPKKIWVLFRIMSKYILKVLALKKLPDLKMK